MMGNRSWFEIEIEEGEERIKFEISNLKLDKIGIG